MAELMPDNTCDVEIFDYLIVPSVIYGDEVRFGIQTHDFLQFMRSRHPNVDVPPLPFEEVDPDEDRELLREKVVILRQYMKDLLAIPDIFDDACIPLFLQSHIPMGEIREVIASQEAAEIFHFNQQGANNLNAQQAAANNDQQEAAVDEIAQEAAVDEIAQEAAVDENAQDAAAEANNDQQVGANDGNAQPAAEANNDQKVGANVGCAQQAAIGNRDGNESCDGELAAGGNSSGNESDEPIFHMEDV